MEKQFQINIFSVSLRKVAIVSEDVITNRACKSRARKRGWGSWGQEVHILHVNI